MAKNAVRPIRLAVTLSHIDGISSAPRQHDLLAMASDADAAGVDQIVLSEHVALPEEILGHPGARPGDPITRFPFPSDEEYPDPLVALAAIAAVTRRARLSTNVLIAPLRPAVLLAKMVATLDVLSGGRVDLGVGVGWQLDEFAAVGVPFEGVGGRLEDLVGACQALWRGGPASFESPTVSFTGMVCSPTPVQGADLPVWFGGSARRTTARRVARLGHGWSPIGNTTPEDIELGCRLIAEECDAIGRDASEIAVRCSLPLVRGAGGAPDLTATMGGAQALGGLGGLGPTVVQLPPLGQLVEKAADVGPFLSRAVAALRAAPS